VTEYEIIEDLGAFTGVVILPQRQTALVATPIAINTMGSGLATVADHLTVLTACANALALG
jgi:hypothetical protein